MLPCFDYHMVLTLHHYQVPLLKKASGYTVYRALSPKQDFATTLHMMFRFLAPKVYT